MNKPKLGLIFLMTLTSLNLFGQFEMGIKVGFGTANIRTTDVPFYASDKVHPLIAFNGGLYTQLDFTDKFQLNSDMLLTTRGFNMEYALETTIIYLEIPVLVSYSLMEKLEFELGPTLGIRLWDSDQKVSFKPFDLGLTSGFRYILNDTYSLTARYTHGLTSIAALFTHREQESKSFNRVIQLSLGCKFNARSDAK